MLIQNAPGSLQKLLTQKSFGDLSSEDSEDVFSYAISSLLLVDRIPEALELARRSPRTEEMSQHIRDYALGLFFRGKSRSALKMIQSISDRKTRNHTRLQLVKKRLDVGMAFPKGESSHEIPLLIEKESFLSENLSRILRQCAGQKKSAKMIHALCSLNIIERALLNNARRNGDLQFCSFVHNLMLKNFLNVISVTNDDTLSKEVRESVIDIVQTFPRKTFPSQEDVLKKAIQSLLKYYAQDSREPWLFYDQFKPFLEKLSRLGFLNEAVQEAQNICEQLKITDMCFRVNLFAKVITTSIKSGKCKEAIEMIPHIPKELHSSVVTKAVVACLVSEQKDDAIRLFTNYLNVFDADSIEKLFYVFLVMEEREVISQVVTKMASEPEKYAQVLQTFLTYCLTTDHLDFLPTPGKDIPQDTFDKMRVVLLSTRKKTLDNEHRERSVLPLFWGELTTHQETHERFFSGQDVSV
jgi:hypothetical protein